MHQIFDKDYYRLEQESLASSVFLISSQSWFCLETCQSTLLEMQRCSVHWVWGAC